MAIRITTKDWILKMLVWCYLDQIFHVQNLFGNL